ncbi:hypothetical protein RUM44_001140 [Polyplax serrata]|uniref:Uncharacterized protein n=1 Tax=Polyplax serrata TaxID=468196 RepID=A0ABR1B9K7_POLSC
MLSRCGERQRHTQRERERERERERNEQRVVPGGLGPARGGNRIETRVFCPQDRSSAIKRKGNSVHVPGSGTKLPSASLIVIMTNRVKRGVLRPGEMETEEEEEEEEEETSTVGGW